jgi:Uma2 family endonuclease
MSTVEQSFTIGRESNGTLMTPEEFDAISDWDREFTYELINGVLIVTPSPSAGERAPSDLLAYLLLNYRENHPEGSTLNLTLPEQTFATGNNRRRADRVIWCGLDRDPDPDDIQDVPTIVIEMVSADRRDRRRDYEAKRSEYSQIGVREYWIMDRFQRRVTICRFEEQGETEAVLSESDVLSTPLLPGFELPLSRWFAEADRFTPRNPREED